MDQHELFLCLPLDCDIPSVQQNLPRPFPITEKTSMVLHLPYMAVAVHNP
jgi:hypothetical protein